MSLDLETFMFFVIFLVMLKIFNKFSIYTLIFIYVYENSYKQLKINLTFDNCIYFVMITRIYFQKFYNASHWN